MCDERLKYPPRGAKLAFLREASVAPVDGPCVLWPFANKRGYGDVVVDGVRWQAHAYALTIRSGSEGQRPAGLIACHGPCHQPLCLVHLHWGTYGENARDKLRDGTHHRGTRSGKSKLTDADVLDIASRLKRGETQRPIGRVYGVTGAAISMIARGRSWSWLTGIAQA